MQDILSLFPNIASLDLQDYFILAINFLLLIFARQLVLAIYHEPDNSAGIERKIHIIRALSLLVFIVYFFFYTQQGKQHGGAFLVLGVLGIIYLAYLVSQLLAYVILRYYGRERDVGGKKRFVSTYHTRLLSIFSSVFIGIIALISVVRLLGLDSWLQAGGVIGFIGVFLALTNAVWAPDIFSGLIILNSDMLEEGDIVEFHDNETIYALVYKTKVFHTVILNLVDNHRIMIRNSRLRDFTIHNLSKFASAKGLRESLRFKISYDISSHAVRTMLQAAYEKIRADKSIAIESSRELEIGIHELGDHAVEWRVYYYTKMIEALPSIRQQLLDIFLETANEHQISLATPLTHVIHQPDLRVPHASSAASQ